MRTKKHKSYIFIKVLFAIMTLSRLSLCDDYYGNKLNHKHYLKKTDSSKDEEDAIKLLNFNLNYGQTRNNHTNHKNHHQTHFVGETNVLNVLSEVEMEKFVRGLPLHALDRLHYLLTRGQPQLAHRYVLKLLSRRIEDRISAGQPLSSNFVDSLVKILIVLMKKDAKQQFPVMAKPRPLFTTRRPTTTTTSTTTTTKRTTTTTTTTIKTTQMPILVENFEIFKIPYEVFLKNLHHHNHHTSPQNHKKVTTMSNQVTQKPDTQPIYINLDQLTSWSHAVPQRTIFPKNPSPLMTQSVRKDAKMVHSTINLVPANYNLSRPLSAAKGGQNGHSQFSVYGRRQGVWDNGGVVQFSPQLDTNQLIYPATTQFMHNHQGPSQQWEVQQQQHPAVHQNGFYQMPPNENNYYQPMDEHNNNNNYHHHQQNHHHEQNSEEEQPQKKKKHHKDKHHNHHKEIDGFIDDSLLKLQNAVIGDDHKKKNKRKKHKNHHHQEENEDDENAGNDLKSGENSGEATSTEKLAAASQLTYEHYSKKASEWWDKAKEYFKEKHEKHKKKKKKKHQDAQKYDGGYNYNNNNNNNGNKGLKNHDDNDDDDDDDDHHGHHSRISTKILGISLKILMFVAFGVYIVNLLFQVAVVYLMSDAGAELIGQLIQAAMGRSLSPRMMARNYYPLQFDYHGRRPNYQTGGSSSLEYMDDLERRVERAVESVRQVIYLVGK